MEESSEVATSAVTLTTLSGSIVLEISPAPEKISDVKAAVLDSKDVPIAFQKIMLGDLLLEDTYTLDAGCTNLTFIIDESALSSWDIAGNPNARLLSGSGGDVLYSNEEYDYVNVITQEPIRRGFHYFEFVMHKVGDEQWCGVTLSKDRAGHRGGHEPGWFYYSGRRYGDKGAFTVGGERNRIKDFEHVKDGDIIGMIVDADAGIIVFTLNGRLQGAGAIPKQPLYLSTSLDREDDRVELRKLADSPLDITAVRNLTLDGSTEESDSEEGEADDVAVSITSDSS